MKRRSVSGLIVGGVVAAALSGAAEARGAESPRRLAMGEARLLPEDRVADLPVRPSEAVSISRTALVLDAAYVDVRGTDFAAGPNAISTSLESDVSGRAIWLSPFGRARIGVGYSGGYGFSSRSVSGFTLTSTSWSATSTAFLDVATESSAAHGPWLLAAASAGSWAAGFSLDAQPAGTGRADDRYDANTNTCNAQLLGCFTTHTRTRSSVRRARSRWGAAGSVRWSGAPFDATFSWDGRALGVEDDVGLPYAVAQTRETGHAVRMLGRYAAPRRFRLAAEGVLGWDRVEAFSVANGPTLWAQTSGRRLNRFEVTAGTARELGLAGQDGAVVVEMTRAGRSGAAAAMAPSVGLAHSETRLSAGAEIQLAPGLRARAGASGGIATGNLDDPATFRTVRTLRFYWGAAYRAPSGWWIEYGAVRYRGGSPQFELQLLSVPIGSTETSLHLLRAGYGW